MESDLSKFHAKAQIYLKSSWSNKSDFHFGWGWWGGGSEGHIANSWVKVLNSVASSYELLLDFLYLLHTYLEVHTYPNNQSVKDLLQELDFQHYKHTES